MRKAKECKNIEDIRSAIDKIDNQIISFISKRSDYVKAATKFKKDEISVKAPDRVKSMLIKRRKWAEEYHINPDFIEDLISNEMKTWQNEQSQFL